LEVSSLPTLSSLLPLDIWGFTCYDLKRDPAERQNLQSEAAWL